MAIKMRVNKNSNVKCSECKTEWENTSEMYDLCINNQIFHLCKKCTDVIFQKTLKASCIYNSRVKTKEDQQRIVNEYTHYNTKQSNTMSVTEALKGIKTEG